MLISEAISAAAALTGQVVTNATLVRWLSELDGRLAFEFYRADAWTPYDPTDDLSCELLVPFPWDGMYVHHLAAQTYFTNGEYDRYENERVMSEKMLADFRSFMQRTQSRLCGCGFPTEKSGGSGVTVIPGDECHGPWFWLSAYALAVKHGYKGTEEEWVDEQREYVDASLAAKNAAETARDLAYGYSGNAAERAAAAAISAGSASEAAINAATSATSASGSATSAAASATAAGGSATSAAASADAAAASAAAAGDAVYVLYSQSATSAQKENAFKAIAAGYANDKPAFLCFTETVSGWSGGDEYLVPLTCAESISRTYKSSGVTHREKREEYKFSCIDKASNRVFSGYVRESRDETSSSVSITYTWDISSEPIQPDVPPSDGTYTLKATKSGSTVTYSWVADT